MPLQRNSQRAGRKIPMNIFASPTLKRTEVRAPMRNRLIDDYRNDERRPDSLIQVGDSRINLRSGYTQSPGGNHKLRRKELALLTFLYQNKGAVFTREELLRQVWNYRGVLITRTVDQTMASLRRKLCDNSRKPRHLLTSYGVGYELRTACQSEGTQS
jgi:DNA-binding response OmpR family regulator